MITDYQPLISYFLLTGLALVVLLADALTSRKRNLGLGWLTAAGALAAIVVDWLPHGQVSLWRGVVTFDGYSRAFDTVFLVTLAVVAVGSVAEERRMRFVGEYYALLILSTIGLMLMAAAGGLVALYAGVELSTISLFALVGFSKRDRRSAEAALKMFILGSVASAVILYGASILYGVLGTTQYDAWRTASGPGSTAFILDLHGGTLWALWLGLAFVVGGLAFKLSAAPFHAWSPDVYEGSPTTVTAYLSTASKAGAFAALLRFLLVALGPASDHWVPVVMGLAVLSMVLGNIVALAQTNLKRLLAYSGIAQVGYILVAVAGAAGARGGLTVGAVLMYLFLYAFTNMGGFLVAQAIEDATGSDQVAALRGLHRRSPLLAFAMLIVLFSLGGIPPLAGFVGKIYLFAAGWQGGQYALVLVGALTSIVALYYYLMAALQVYIRDPEDDRKLPVSKPLAVAVAACTLATLAIGIYPRPIVLLGEHAGRAAAVDLAPQGELAAGTPRHSPLLVGANRP